jgi:hypothetical protein
LRTSGSVDAENRRRTRPSFDWNSKAASRVEGVSRGVIEVDALPGQTFKAPIARIADAEDPQTRMMRIEIDLPASTLSWT